HIYRRRGKRGEEHYDTKSIENKRATGGAFSRFISRRIIHVIVGSTHLRNVYLECCMRFGIACRMIFFFHCSKITLNGRIYFYIYYKITLKYSYIYIKTRRNSFTSHQKPP